MKFDDNKLRYDLIEPVMFEALVEVLTYGAEKYAPNNWKTVEPERYYSALMRHLVEYRKGRMLDPESNLSHLWHALTNVAFLVWFEQQAEQEPCDELNSCEFVSQSHPPQTLDEVVAEGRALKDRINREGPTEIPPFRPNSMAEILAQRKVYGSDSE